MKNTHERFSIHSPLAGRDGSECFAGSPQIFFNPLAPCGARRAGSGPYTCAISFSIHSPLAGRDQASAAAATQAAQFSIHSPLAGRDRCSASMSRRDFRFQSTRPLRGETVASSSLAFCSSFQSTRPLRGETRGNRAGRGPDLRFFNPLAPCGARRNCLGQQQHGRDFSIHSPLAGRDATVVKLPVSIFAFQSTRPLRGET